MPGQVERLTLLVPPGEAKVPESAANGLMFVTTTRPYDRVALEQSLVGSNRTEALGGERPAFRLSRAPEFLIAFVNARNLVVGKAGSMHWFLNRDPNPVEKGPVSDAIRAVGENHLLVAGLAVEPPNALAFPDRLPMKGKEKGGLRGGMMPEGQALSDKLKKEIPFVLWPGLPLLDFDQALLTLDAPDDPRLELRLTYPDEDRAQRAQVALFAEIGLGRQMVKAGGVERATNNTWARHPFWATLSVGAAAAGPASLPAGFLSGPAVSAVGCSGGPERRS